MATEQVCIILNEREPAKERLAQTLFAKLNSQGIAAKRLSADPKLDKIIKQRTAKIYVLDYILGDYTTGLDLLANMKDWEEAPSAIFLTDEPSLEVAVQAMKLGAVDYISTESADALDRTMEIIKKLAKQIPQIKKPQDNYKKIKFTNITANARTTSKAMQEAKALAGGSLPLTIILGESGVGKTTWAQSMMNHSTLPGYFSAIDWGLCCEPAARVLGLHLSEGNPHKFGSSKSLIIESIEHDSGDLFGAYSEAISKNTAAKGKLIVTTSCPKTAQMWEHNFSGQTLKIPSLRERLEDIPEISQTLLNNALEILDKKSLALNKQLLEFLTNQNWPGNLNQLKKVLFEVALLSDNSKIEEVLKQAYQDALATFEAPHRTPGFLEAQLTLDRFCGDYRIAAMHLGTSVPSLYRLLNSNAEA